MNPVYLATRIGVIVSQPKWGGGVHRDHLRELLGCSYQDLNQAIGIAYRRRLVDASYGWIMALPAPGSRERAA